ncbi:hypothetical protein G7Y89_g9652 [Cudoniella acicularis]|uniref:Uncharacterized protein n=1 Tax=Cudoniella acicularis TaxID=354080 RepID=A0A8H4RGJ0_9HELO|nr:hypothetical protein G7Y89_g9652 [Cudoniella acicularis]
MANFKSILNSETKMQSFVTHCLNTKGNEVVAESYLAETQQAGLGLQNLQTFADDVAVRVWGQQGARQFVSSPETPLSLCNSSVEVAAGKIGRLFRFVPAILM